MDISNFRNNLLIKSQDMSVVQFKEYAVELISELEKRSGEDYNKMRGELAEVLLEVLLRDIGGILNEEGYKYQLIKNLAMIKRGKNGKLYSSEIDVCFCTEFKCYLFECKSYKGEKTLTGECMLNGFKKMDIAGQSKMHFDFFKEIFDECRLKYVGGRGNLPKPYKLVFFEFSDKGVTDKRKREDKDRIPLLTYSNFYEFFLDELKNKDKQWDLVKLEKNMKKLDSKRDLIMDYHVKRLN